MLLKDIVSSGEQLRLLDVRPGRDTGLGHGHQQDPLWAVLPSTCSKPVAVQFYIVTSQWLLDLTDMHIYIVPTC
jgi:hypothetical protein